MSTPRVYASNGDWSLVGSDNLLVSVWRSEVQLAGIEATDRAIVSILGDSGEESYGSVTVIEPTMALRMPEEAREASTALQKRWMNRMRCSAYLVRGNSFAMAAVRTMTAGMSLLTRSPYPIRSFSDAFSAADWVGREMGMDVDRVLATINRARDAT